MSSKKYNECKRHISQNFKSSETRDPTNIRVNANNVSKLDLFLSCLSVSYSLTLFTFYTRFSVPCLGLRAKSSRLCLLFKSDPTEKLREFDSFEFESVSGDEEKQKQGFLTFIPSTIHKKGGSEFMDFLVIK